MADYYSGMAGIGILLAIILYVGLLALSIWISYLIIRLADRERGRMR